MPFDGSNHQGGPDGSLRADLSRRSPWLPGVLGRCTGRHPDSGPDVQQNSRVEVLQILTVARQLVADRHRWAQGHYETWGGRRCAVGAICVASEMLHTLASLEAVEHLSAVASRRGFPDVEAMNDHSTHTEVLSAFDDAIECASRLFLGRRLPNVEV